MLYHIDCPRCGVKVEAAGEPIPPATPCPGCGHVIDLAGLILASDDGFAPEPVRRRKSNPWTEEQFDGKWRSVRTGLTCIGWAAGIGLVATVFEIIGALGNDNRAAFPQQMSFFTIVAGAIQLVLVITGQALCCRTPAGHPARTWALVSFVSLLLAMVLLAVLVATCIFERVSVMQLLTYSLPLVMACICCALANHLSYLLFAYELGKSFHDETQTTLCVTYFAGAILLTCAIVAMFLGNPSWARTLVWLICALWLALQVLFLSLTLRAPISE